MIERLIDFERCRIHDLTERLESYRNRPMTMGRVQTAVFLRICANYHDRELKQHYDDAYAFLTRHEAKIKGDSRKRKNRR